MLPTNFVRKMRPALAGAMMVCAVIASLGTRAADAQVTVDSLIGKSVTDVSPEMSKPIQQAITLFTNRQFDDARKLLKQTCDAYTQLPPSGVMMAQMFVAANQGLAARGELERCVLADPKDPEPYLVFGDLAFQNRQITESGLCFDRANELCSAYNANPRRKRDLQIRAYAGLAAVASAREQFKLEEEMLKNWIAIEPDSTAAYTRLARCEFKQGGKDNIQKAYATFKKLYDEIDKEPDPTKKVPRPEVNMAVLYGQADDIKDADKVAKQLMGYALERAAPSDINTRLAVSQWGLENGDLDMAKKGAAAAAQIDPDSLQALLLAGAASRYENDADKAEQLFRRALSKAPSNFAAMNNLALTLIDQDDETKRKQAMEFAQLNQRINNNLQNPAGREAAATLAWVAFKSGNEADAERGMIQILQSGSISNEAAYRAAVVLHKRGKTQEALQILDPLLSQTRYFPGKEEAQALKDKLGTSSDLSPLP